MKDGCEAQKLFSTDRETNQPDEEYEQGHFLKYTVVCGVLSCVYNRANVVLTGKMDAKGTGKWARNRI